jgi:predicted dehydrogenase
MIGRTNSAPAGHLADRPPRPRPLRVALLGCGAVSRLYYAPALAALEQQGEVEVCALLDPDKAAVAELLRSFPSARAMSASDEVPSGIDLGIVASPPAVHAAQAIALLGDGVAVLCEKPMATSSTEGLSMVQAAEAAGSLLAVGMVRRFLPAVDIIARILRGGVLGSSLRIICREGGDFRWPTRATSFFDLHGGGVLMDIGVHVLDLLSQWLGPAELLVYEDDAMGGVEANCRIRLSYGSDISADVRLSRDSPQPNRYLFTGSAGWLSWDIYEPGGMRMGFYDTGYAIDAKLHLARTGSFPTPLGPVANGLEEAFVFQMQNMIRAIRGQEKVAVDGRGALAGIAMIERCYANRRLMPMPWLSDAELLAAMASR